MGRGSWVAIAGLAAAALTAAGCGGGGGGDRLTIEEFRTQADAICKEYDGKFDDLGEPKAASELPDFMAKGTELAKAQLAALRELSPPEDVQDTIDEAYATLEEQIGLFGAFGEAGAAEDTAKMQELSTKMDELDDKADKLAEDVGLKECGGS